METEPKARTTRPDPDEWREAVDSVADGARLGGDQSQRKRRAGTPATRAGTTRSGNVEPIADDIGTREPDVLFEQGERDPGTPRVGRKPGIDRKTGTNGVHGAHDRSDRPCVPPRVELEPLALKLVGRSVTREAGCKARADVAGDERPPQRTPTAGKHEIESRGGDEAKTATPCGAGHATCSPKGMVLRPARCVAPVLEIQKDKRDARREPPARLTDPRGIAHVPGLTHTPAAEKVRRARTDDHRHARPVKEHTCQATPIREPAKA